LTLTQNYPNPFNPSTVIEFGLPNPGNVVLEIYNALGQRVRSLSDGYFEAGYHSIIWDGRSDNGAEVGSGIYYYRLISGDYRISKKMLLVK